MHKKVHLMTTSPIRQEDGVLKSSDKLIWDALRRRGVAGGYFMPQEVSVVFEAEEPKLYKDGQVINPEILLIRSSRDAEERTYEVGLVYDSLGGTVSDPVSSLIYPVGKLLPFIYRQGKIPTLKSCFFTKDTQNIQIIYNNIPFPFIVKPQKGYAGGGVVLIHNDTEFRSYLSTTEDYSLIAQEYITDIEDEFRVIVVDGKGLGVVKKVSNSLTHNAAQGAVFEKVEEPEIIKFAEQAVALESGDVYGVDIIRTNSGQLYLLENNRNPSFTEFREATDIAVEDKIIDFITQVK